MNCNLGKEDRQRGKLCRSMDCTLCSTRRNAEMVANAEKKVEAVKSNHVVTIHTNRLFDYQLNTKGIEALRFAKEQFSDFQEAILGNLLPGRNNSMVKTKLEEASFYMSKAIAEQSDNHQSINTH